MFFVLAAGLIACMAVSVRVWGSRGALWRGWVAALLLLPPWIDLRVGAVTVDLRTVAAVVGLAAVWAWEPLDGRFRWRVADGLVGALVGVLVLSEFLAGPFGLLTAVEVCRVWLLPYVVGRVFLRSADDVPGAVPVVAAAAGLISLYAAAEAVTHVNPVNALMGKVYVFLEGDSGHRWGLKRAQAVFGHPLYLGYLLALALPWAVEARRRTAPRGPRWLRLAPVAVGVALLCTASRGPIMAGAVTAAAPVLFARPRLRAAAPFVALAAAAGVVAFQDAVIDALARVAGEKDGDATQMLVVNGQEVEYTGTNHRILLFDVYGDALDGVELFGYGSLLAAADTEDVPVVFRSVDCHYLLFTLQHGYTALALFVALAAATLVDLGRAVADPGSPLGGFAAGLFGAVALVTAFLFTVWWSPDFGSVWLFTAGLAGSLRDRAVGAGNLMVGRATAVRQPRLVTNHALVRTREDA